MTPIDPKNLLASALGLGPGETPFPWQEDLLERLGRGEIPPALDIPTGLGKTSVMAIWLLARMSRPTLPRRLVYIVDRRAVVDQATEVAVGLRDWVTTSPEVQNHLGLQGRPLPISTLRGRYVDNREWLEDPTVPAIIVGTVDMIGSRLLFEGYGVSRKMRPYHAGLLGVDTLVVLDEAHLVPPFEHLLRSIEEDGTLRRRNGPADYSLPSFRLMTLSATGRALQPTAMGLTDRDYRHPIVCKRLNARKALRILKLSEGEELGKELANWAWELCGKRQKPARVLVFSDSRKVAQEAQREFKKLVKERKKYEAGLSVDTELFVGGRRVFEREHAKKRLKELGFLARNSVTKTPAVLFATSAAEVGVDLDSDHMVCDLVAWERMVQRLGRVNRRGECDDAEVIVIAAPPSKEEQELLEQVDGTRKRLKKIEKRRKAVEVRKNSLRVLGKLRLVGSSGNKLRDASPAAILELKNRAQETLKGATTPEPLRPQLTQAVVDAWAMTSLQMHPGRPPIQPWLRGWVEDPPQTVVVWRRWLPVRSGKPPVKNREVDGFFEAAPPHVSEMLETETLQVAEWLWACAQRVQKAKESDPGRTAEESLNDGDVVAFLLEPDGTFRKSLTLKELEDKKVGQQLKRQLKGAILIVDARLGGLDENGLLDEKVAAVPRTADDGQPWLEEGAVGFRVRRADATTPASSDQNWRERFRFAVEVSAEGEPSTWLIVEKWQGSALTEEDRAVGPPQLLDEHAQWAEKRARELARALGFPPQYEEALAIAARLHDEGKRAQRWQRAFNAPTNGVYAKTPGPIDYDLLDGYRHELGSLLSIQNNGRLRGLPRELQDLVLHLVAAHHGFARPVIGLKGCEGAPPSKLKELARDVALRFAKLNARWGPWGLTWWEALLRAADQQASRQNEEQDRATGEV